MVDASGWIEFYMDGPLSKYFAPYLEDHRKLIVSPICIIEVFNRLFPYSGDEITMKVVEQMNRCHVVPIDSDIAIEAAHICTTHSIPIKESIVLATSWKMNVILYTKNFILKGLPYVHYIA